MVFECPQPRPGPGRAIQVRALQLALDMRMISDENTELGFTQNRKPFPRQLRREQRSQTVFNARNPVPAAWVRVDLSRGAEELRKQTQNDLQNREPAC